MAVQNLGNQANKLTFNFKDRPEFRSDGKKVDLQKATDELKVIGKDGQEKTVKGFKGADGLFYALKDRTNNGGGWQIDVYGEPAQLNKQKFTVQGGDITRARFGDVRYRKPEDEIEPKSFGVSGTNNPDTFAAAYGLQRRGGAVLDAGDLSAGQAPAPPLKDDEEAKQTAKLNQAGAGSPSRFAINREDDDDLGEPEEAQSRNPAMLDVESQMRDLDAMLKDAQAASRASTDPAAPASAAESGQRPKLDLNVPASPAAASNISLGSSENALLQKLGRKPVETLEGNIGFYAALAHGVNDSSATFKLAAVATRDAFLNDLQRVITSNDETKLGLLAPGLTGEDRAWALDLLTQALQDPDNKSVGGYASLQLAAMQSKKPVVTLSEGGRTIFSPDGSFKEYSAKDASAFDKAFGELQNPAVIMQSGDRWFATEKS